MNTSNGREEGEDHRGQDVWSEGSQVDSEVSILWGTQERRL